MAQQEGVFPRINGGMLQTQQYTDMLVSVVGKLVGPTTLQACDGTNITLNTESAQEGLVVNPDLSIEIMGTAVDATTVMAFVSRELSADMDLDVYNKMIMVQNNPKFAHYFHDMAATN